MICVVPDTNVLMHARKLVALPWNALDADEVQIALVGPVLSEIDKHKIKSGRIGRRAKEISADIREILKMPEWTKVLRDKSPRVTVAIFPGIDLHGRLHASLNLDNMDHQIINHCLALAGEGRDVRLLTNDTLASLVAAGAGIEAVLLPEEWLLEPEADENEKKLRQAKAEIDLLRSQEPRMTAQILGHDGQTLTRISARVRRYPALLDYQIRDLIDQAVALCPPAEDFGPASFAEAIAEEEKSRGDDPFGFAKFQRAASVMMEEVFHPVTEEEIHAYRTVTYKAWLDELKRSLERVHHRFDNNDIWPQFNLVTANNGTRPADNVLIELTARGDVHLGRVFIEKPREGAPKRSLSLPSPPVAPRGAILRRDRFSHLAGFMRTSTALEEQMRRLGEHSRGTPILPASALPDFTALNWKPEPGKAASGVRGKCHTWRHHSPDRRTNFFVEAVCEPSEARNARGSIDLRISAHNLTDVVQMSLPVEIEVEVGDTLTFAGALIDDLPKQALNRVGPEAKTR